MPIVIENFIDRFFGYVKLDHVLESEELYDVRGSKKPSLGTSGRHYHRHAAEMARTQPPRKYLAVHVRQLALQPRLHILQRSRQFLLSGLEQARRSALEDHVHWLRDWAHGF